MHGGKDGVDSEGVWTDTEDKDCAVCKCDLFMSAVVSPERPSEAVCPEHASHFPPDRSLLYRYPSTSLPSHPSTPMPVLDSP